MNLKDCRGALILAEVKRMVVIFYKQSLYMVFRLGCPLERNNLCSTLRVSCYHKQLPPYLLRRFY